VRVTTAFNRLLDLPGTRVTAVTFTASMMSVTVRLRRRRLACPHCGYTTGVRHDTRPVDSVWRHLDLGARRLQVHARLRRLACPTHGVVVEGVPFARPDAKFTRDFEALVGWLAITMDQTALARMLRIDWDTVVRIITRVLGEVLDPDRLDDLFVIGVDEVAWRKVIWSPHSDRGVDLRIHVEHSVLDVAEWSVTDGRTPGRDGAPAAARLLRMVSAVDELP
jgi:transposase